MPSLPLDHRFVATPDWVCEIISAASVRIDKVHKMRICAEFGVPHYWLVDPGNRSMDVFRLESGKWILVSSHLEDDKVRAEPFDAVEFDLKDLWA